MLAAKSFICISLPLFDIHIFSASVIIMANKLLILNNLLVSSILKVHLLRCMSTNAKRQVKRYSCYFPTIEFIVMINTRQFACYLLLSHDSQRKKYFPTPIMT